VCWKIVKEKWDGSALQSGYLNNTTAPGYVLPYKKNHITKKKGGTIGVFAFETREFAEAYLQKDTFRGGKYIVKAIGFGKLPTPPRISYANYVIDLYRVGFDAYIEVDIDVQEPPKGTVVYEALTILETKGRRSRHR
jgi:hypothetical protein